MKRLNLQSLTPLILFGILFAVCGPISFARADDPPNVEVIAPTKGASIDLASGPAGLIVKFKTNNGFSPKRVFLRLGGDKKPSTATKFTYNGISRIYATEFPVTAGTYPNTRIEIQAIKPEGSDDHLPQNILVKLTNITVTKQP